MDPPFGFNRGSCKPPGSRRDGEGCKLLTLPAGGGGGLAEFLRGLREQDGKRARVRERQRHRQRERES